MIKLDRAVQIANLPQLAPRDGSACKPAANISLLREIG